MSLTLAAGSLASSSLPRAPTRIVVLEFPSYEKAHEWWHSAEYAPAKELRQRLSTTDLLIIDGHRMSP